ncbi:MAG: energy transducer TonB [Flavobacteriaceae bacterium]
MADHVRNNLQYPETALESYDQGKVVVMLEIQIDGSIAIIKNIGPSRVLEHEAARIIRLLPTMKPAVHQGIPIKVSYSLPINFSQ